MKTNYAITKAFLYSMVVLAVISVGLVGYFWIKNEYARFKKEEIALREEYVESQKSLIRHETGQVIDYVGFKVSQAENRLKQIIYKLYFFWRENETRNKNHVKR